MGKSLEEKVFDRRRDRLVFSYFSNTKKEYSNKRLELDEPFRDKPTCIREVTFNRCVFTGSWDKCEFYGCKFYDCSFLCNLSFCSFVKSQFIKCSYGEIYISHTQFHLDEFEELDIKTTNGFMNWVSVDSCKFSNSYISFVVQEPSITSNEFNGCRFVDMHCIGYLVSFHDNKFDTRCRHEGLDLLACGFVPSHGSFTGWKRLIGEKDGERFPVIIRLEIPEDAERCSVGVSRECRYSKAMVIAVYGVGSWEELEGVEVHSSYDDKILYCVGEMVMPEGSCGERMVNSGNGIHFFTTREEAEAYGFGSGIETAELKLDNIDCRSFLEK